MITKCESVPLTNQVVSYADFPGYRFPYYEYAGGRMDRISYDVGPQYSRGRLNWKRCTHETKLEKPLDVTTKYYQSNTGSWFTFRCPPPPYPSAPVPQLKQSTIDEATQKVVSQFDLNCKDGVLLYSGILQAVPLVGGCFKFVSIMNRIARKFTRNFRKQPFTTVVKTAISLDFIDRFVVSPTIDDARKFLDSHNYVVRVMNTLSERNQEPVALSSVAQSEDYRSSGSLLTNTWGWDNARYEGTWLNSSGTQYGLHTLCKLDYDAGSVSPLKLWAARVGITSPLDSVWDLVPFSFVVDYFSRAGDFISALSEEMSSQDGLRGRLGKVYDQWYTAKRYSTYTYDIQSCKLNYGRGEIFFPGPHKLTAGQVTFDRYPVSFAQLNSGLLKSDSDLIHWDLTNRRAGTLAELFIQAKL